MHTVQWALFFIRHTSRSVVVIDINRLECGKSGQYFDFALRYQFACVQISLEWEILIPFFNQNSIVLTLLSRSCQLNDMWEREKVFFSLTNNANEDALRCLIGSWKTENSLLFSHKSEASEPAIEFWRFSRFKVWLDVCFAIRNAK